MRQKKIKNFILKWIKLNLEIFYDYENRIKCLNNRKGGKLYHLIIADELIHYKMFSHEV